MYCCSLYRAQRKQVQINRIKTHPPENKVLRFCLNSVFGELLELFYLFEYPVPPDFSRIRLFGFPDKGGFAHNQIIGEQAPITRILRVLHLVAAHKIIIVREDVRWKRHVIVPQRIFAEGKRITFLPLDYFLV